MEASDWARLEGVLDSPVMPHVAALRQQFPALTFSVCDAEDLADSSPFRRGPAIDVFLVDGRNHCVCLTQDPSVATGLVLARRAVSV